MLETGCQAPGRNRGGLIMQFGKLFNTVRPLVTAIAGLAVGAVLIFAVYYTLFSLQWVTFLAGVLVAAVLAEATRVSRAEWVLVRRTKQLSALRDKLERETRLRKRAEDAVAADAPRLQLV